jgi:hypothetical protein
MRGCTFFERVHDHIQEAGDVFACGNHLKTNKEAETSVPAATHAAMHAATQGHALKIGSRQWLKHGCMQIMVTKLEQILSSRAQHGAAPQCRFITSGW